MAVAERLNTLGCSDCSECCDGRGWDYDDDVECETTAVPTKEFVGIFEILGVEAALKANEASWI